MRCPDCNKFVSFDTDNEPECEEPDVNGTTVTLSARIVNTCSDCGTELKEANLEMSADFELPEKHKEGCEGEVRAEVESSERTERSTAAKLARYSKRFYGATAEVHICCDCKELDVTLTLADEVQASGMEELV